MLRVPVLGDGAGCLFPDQLYGPGMGSYTLLQLESLLLCMDETCKCGKSPSQTRLVAVLCLQGGFTLHFCAASFWMLEQRVREGNSFHRPASLMRHMDQWLSEGSAKALSNVTPKGRQCSMQQKQDSCLPQALEPARAPWKHGPQAKTELRCPRPKKLNINAKVRL